MIARFGRTIGIRLGCGFLGATIGAILGALAAIPFCFIIPVAPFAGLAVGGVGGYVAGVIGVSFGGPTRFRTGGVIGALASLVVSPLVVTAYWGIPLLVALVVGYFFGGYLDRQMILERPRFAIAQLVRDMIEEAAS